MEDTDNKKQDAASRLQETQCSMQDALSMMNVAVRKREETARRMRDSMFSMQDSEDDLYTPCVLQYTDFLRLHQTITPRPPKSKKFFRLQAEREETKNIQGKANTQIKDLKSGLQAVQEQKDLKDVEMQMRRHIKNSSYLKHNMEQRCIAVKKIQTCQEKNEQIRELLNELNREIIALNKHHRQLKKQMQNCIHGEYISAILKDSKQFQEAKELIEHFTKAKRLHDELLKNMQSKQAEVDKSQSETNRIREEYSFTQGGNVIKIQQLKLELGDSIGSVKAVEKRFKELHKLSDWKTMELGRISRAIYEMSRYLWKMGMSGTMNVEETAALLDKIMEFIHDLRSLWERKEAEKDNPTKKENKKIF
ncbi:uncharacterized protein LOC124399070 [Silurus meridionalis]|uniref:uncharacterized protein LOC124399070 n=1 Tax=Silurus meridionalis TaxID=175797 RepID=UPI001EEAEBAC|nr:uncharacterized protein LOC124399070 [Silurus meridionalis]